MGTNIDAGTYVSSRTEKGIIKRHQNAISYGLNLIANGVDNSCTMLTSISTITPIIQGTLFVRLLALCSPR